MVRDSNIMGVGIYPTQTLVIPNTPRPTAGSMEGLAVPVGKNVVAFCLLPSLLASPLESERVAYPESGLEQNSHPGPNSQV